MIRSLVWALVAAIAAYGLITELVNPCLRTMRTKQYEQQQMLRGKWVVVPLAVNPRST